MLIFINNARSVCVCRPVCVCVSLSDETTHHLRHYINYWDSCTNTHLKFRFMRTVSYRSRYIIQFTNVCQSYTRYSHHKYASNGCWTIVCSDAVRSSTYFWKGLTGNRTVRDASWSRREQKNSHILRRLHVGAFIAKYRRKRSHSESMQLVFSMTEGPISDTPWLMSLPSSAEALAIGFGQYSENALLHSSYTRASFKFQFPVQHLLDEWLKSIHRM